MMEDSSDVAANPYILAFDIGGTKIAAGVFDLELGAVGSLATTPTLADQPAEATLASLKRAAASAMASAAVDGPPAAVGVGSSGPLDVENGRLLDADSLPQLMGFDLANYAREEFQAPLFLENDAGCFALGEAVRGAGAGHSVVVGVTLGTGFGCGIVIDGRLFSGSSHNAGEVAYCPAAGGNFDEMLSGAGVRRFFERVSGRPGPSAQEIGEMGERGDGEALTAWHHYGHALGTALGTIAAIVDPSICVVGGSVASRFALFSGPMERAFERVVLSSSKRPTRIVPAELGAAAGVTGAAVYAKQRYTEKR